MSIATSSVRARNNAKGQGQWALGHTEPLNPNEQQKKDDNPLNVRARIENVYAHRGFAAIDPADLRGRFRWWGLYTQRRQGLDGTSTGVLEPEDIEDEYFMLRVRVDGGRLTVAQLRTIADVSRRYARDTADLTDRQNVQLHWVRIEDVPEIWRRLDEVGLSTQEACGDCPRVIIGSPVAGVAAAEVLDASPAIAEIAARYIGDPTLSNLPRKYKTAISWLPDVPYEANDVSFLGAVHPDLGPGYDLWVGGGLATNPMLAQRLGAWVPLADVPEVWLAVTSLFRDYGYRRLRNRARLKYLLADWGTARFREVLENEYLTRKLDDLDAPEAPPELIDHIGVHRQADGRHYIGGAPLAGRTSGTILGRVADLAERYGSDRIGTTAMQKLLILDVDEAHVPAVTAGLRDLGLPADPSPWRRATMACTGIEYCKLALVDTKARAAATVAELERRLPEMDTPLSIHVNGCPNACARTQNADIGLKGQLILVDGRRVEGFQVHLGGGFARHAGLGRKLRGHKVAATELADYVERVARNYLAGRADGEVFADWAARAGEEELR